MVPSPVLKKQKGQPFPYDQKPYQHLPFCRSVPLSDLSRSVFPIVIDTSAADERAWHPLMRERGYHYLKRQEHHNTDSKRKQVIKYILLPDSAWKIPYWFQCETALYCSPLVLRKLRTAADCSYRRYLEAFFAGIGMPVVHQKNRLPHQQLTAYTELKKRYL